MAPRLLFVVNDPAFFVSHRSGLALAARQAGYDVHVAAPDADATASLRSLGFPLHDIRLQRRSLNPASELLSIHSLYRLYRRVRPNLTHHLTIKPVVYGGVASRMARVPAVVNTITGLGWAFVGPGTKARLARFVAHSGYRRALRHPNARTIFQNPDDLATFVGDGLIDPSRAVVIRGSGVDPARFPLLAPSTNEPPLVILPGRMLWDKGVGTFVQAAELLAHAGVQARFALVGGVDSGNRSAVPEEHLREWHRAGVVEWWGHKQEMLSVYEQADVVCLPSRGEGVPLALLEAASCGRPIIATDVPGCREAVEHGANGILVPPDDPAMLANAMRLLIDEPDLRHQMGTRGAERVRASFTLQHVIEETLMVYKSLLPPGGAV